jgi:hypothetical protein
MIALERRVNAKNAVASASALNVVQENGNDSHLSAQKLCQEILVEENLVQSILARSFDGTDDLGRMDQFSL